MKRRTKARKQNRQKTKLGLPDLEHVKSAVLVSLRSPESQRSYRRSIDDFVCWYCSEPRLSFNKTVVTRYRIYLEDRLLAPGTINVRLAAVRRLAYEAADTGLLSPDLGTSLHRELRKKASFGAPVHPNCDGVYMSSQLIERTKVTSILVAYDFSNASRKPLLHALTIARHFGAKLHIAYVVSSTGYEIAGPEASQLALDGSQRDAQQLEAALLKNGNLAGLQYEFIIREGNVWEQLKFIIEEKQIDAVVVGTHGREGLGRLLLGSVAEQIFGQANCLVLTVGPGSQENSLIERKESSRPFLFATDFSTASLGALPYAASFANHFGAKLIVLHVLSPELMPSSSHWSTIGDLNRRREEAQSASQKKFEELICRNVPEGIKLEFLIKFGIPVEEIVQSCRTLRADLLILGLRHAAHAAATSHLPRSANEIVCAASCPILTVKDSRDLAQ